MIGRIHAAGARRLAQTLWTRFGTALVVAPAVFAPCCDAVHAEDDCIKAQAVDVSCSGDVTTGYMQVEVSDVEGCPPITSVEFTSFNNRDGEAGYDPENGDIEVNTVTSVSSPPTTSVEVGQFSSSDASGTISATHWQLQVEKADGSISAFSGTF